MVPLAPLAAGVVQISRLLPGPKGLRLVPWPCFPIPFQVDPKSEVKEIFFKEQTTSQFQRVLCTWCAVKVNRFKGLHGWYARSHENAVQCWSCMLRYSLWNFIGPNSEIETEEDENIDKARKVSRMTNSRRFVKAEQIFSHPVCASEWSIWTGSVSDVYEPRDDSENVQNSFICYTYY